jgi:hypothetical protein
MAMQKYYLYPLIHYKIKMVGKKRYSQRD